METLQMWALWLLDVVGAHIAVKKAGKRRLSRHQLLVASKNHETETPGAWFPATYPQVQFLRLDEFRPVQPTREELYQEAGSWCDKEMNMEDQPWYHTIIRFKMVPIFNYHIFNLNLGMCGFLGFGFEVCRIEEVFFHFRRTPWSWYCRRSLFPRHSANGGTLFDKKLYFLSCLRFNTSRK